MPGAKRHLIMKPIFALRHHANASIKAIIVNRGTPKRPSYYVAIVRPDGIYSDAAGLPAINIMEAYRRMLLVLEVLYRQDGITPQEVLLRCQCALVATAHLSPTGQSWRDWVELIVGDTVCNEIRWLSISAMPPEIRDIATRDIVAANRR